MAALTSGVGKGLALRSALSRARGRTAAFPGRIPSNLSDGTASGGILPTTFNLSQTGATSMGQGTHLAWMSWWRT